MAIPIKTICFLLWALFLHKSEQSVFLSAESASKVIRHKRANFLLIEELFHGHLEKECLEERCSYEEAREYFEDDVKTVNFWKNYFDGRQCSSDPCMNNGTCEDTIRSYTCSCPEFYNGNNCQFAKNQCYPQMNEGCQHFCRPGYKSYYCSCAEGYDLAEDDKSCLPTDPYACGRILAPDVSMETKTTSAKQTLQNRFPWQVLIINSDGKDFCSGVILNQNFVLTTAACAQKNNPSSVEVVAGKIQDHEPMFSKQIIQVKNIHVHMRYVAETGENNIALLQLHTNLNYSDYCLPICIPERDFAEYVLMPENSGIVSSWKLQEEGQLQGSLIQFQVSPLEKETCENILNITHTNRVFCGTSQELLNGRLAGGSHFAVEHKGTWFLIGILGSCPSELSNLETFVFTKISRYITWLQKAMKDLIAQSKN
ncbi:vitamin K-dependent protein Z [Microcaecilia unicolor]|uniref:Vitamin K-dependent protein Z n=1 Tax=Microcaecilia unicolor TaxID=1415580 RepID=A0A6P7XWP0_9AMPH|nr:vitamin K-dependent protein Z [Microcaecilia unicolor]